MLQFCTYEHLRSSSRNDYACGPFRYRKSRGKLEHVLPTKHGRTRQTAASYTTARLVDVEPAGRQLDFAQGRQYAIP